MTLKENRLAPKVLLNGVGQGKDGVAKLMAALSLVADWDDLLQQARGHGVFPSLYRRLSEVCPEAVPAEVLGAMQRLYRRNARRSLRLTGELLKVLALLESHGIPALPFKGPALAQMAYGDVALRWFGDLDILVRREDVLRVKDLLAGAGYRPHPSLAPAQERAHLWRNHEISFFHPELTMLDVHWRFADFPGGELDADAAWGRSLPLSLAGKLVPSLAPEDMLLVLCQHGTFHLWMNLGILNDVARLVQAHEPWDWPGLLQRAGNMGLRRRLLLGLSLAQELLAAPLPPEVQRQADRDPAISALSRVVRERLFADRAESGLRERIQRNLFHVKVRERLRDRLTYALIRALSPTEEDWNWISLPDRRYWLYYAVRPLRMAAQGLLLPLWRRMI